MSRKGGRKTLKITVIVSEGIDTLNSKDETTIDLNVFEDMKLGSINQAVSKILQLKAEEKFTYSSDNSKQPFDFERTFKECSIHNGDKLYLESGRKKRKTGPQLTVRSGKRDSSGGDLQSSEHVPGAEEVLELVCTTRIFDQDSSLSSPIRRVRVIVLADHLCKDLIEDVSTLWGRSGLKFKCGRTVLQSNKSFEELGVENNAEIVVTGGRG
jgi:hypothetical protein